MKGEFYKGERVYGVIVESMLDYRNSVYVGIVITSYLISIIIERHFEWNLKNK